MRTSTFDIRPGSGQPTATIHPTTSPQKLGRADKGLWRASADFCPRIIQRSSDGSTNVLPRMVVAKPARATTQPPRRLSRHSRNRLSERTLSDHMTSADLGNQAALNAPGLGADGFSTIPIRRLASLKAPPARSSGGRSKPPHRRDSGLADLRRPRNPGGQPLSTVDGLSAPRGGQR